ncbi:MAG: hypothetical protein GW795_02890 [Cyanobacteria bacterium]|nr:hypothetical protein [Cyanobacteria bacterium CG_2015-16_32_12]NCQ05535.1 hypothetical protein [Cyanobacteria bacterium CG_2015-09_32_10]NCQ40848.1 hypothetical protein [Cyanobacteria bacterium CG_2015-04_32_10]NCS83977.1 hypothetical protein [Cyanobacteria bacterium CG_2015-02_32_10]
MDKDTRFAFLVIGLPFLGLIYCLGIIFLFVVSPFAQNHAFITGILAAMIPFIIAVILWTKASAKAYQKKN